MCREDREKTMPATRGIANKIFEFMKSRPGEALVYTEIEQELELTRNQVSNAMHHLIDRNVGIEKISQGMHVYTGQKSRIGEDGRVFGVVKEMKSGKLLLECSDGNLYVARMLEDL